MRNCVSVLTSNFEGSGEKVQNENRPNELYKNHFAEMTERAFSHQSSIISPMSSLVNKSTSEGISRRCQKYETDD